MKVCSKCLTDKEDSEFNYSARHKFKLQPFCKVCQSEYASDYISQNLDKYKKNMREWRAQNPKAAEVESLKRMIARLIKRGDDRKHPSLGYSGKELKEYLKSNKFEFIRSPEEFPSTFLAGALKNLKAV